MIYYKKNIESMEMRNKINFVNCLVGAKSSNMISTISNYGAENISIFSSVIHLGSNPALIGFLIRPQDNILTDTYRNIIEVKQYGINSISTNMIKNAHYTSKKYKKNESEFELCAIEKEYIDKYPIPFSLDSKIKIGLKYIEEKEIINKCKLIVGEVELIKVDTEYVNNDGIIDFNKINATCITGSSTYNKIEKIDQLAYMRKTIK